MLDILAIALGLSEVSFVVWLVVKNLYLKGGNMKLKDKLYNSIVKILVLLILSNIAYIFYLLINLYFQEETSMLIIKIVDFFAMLGFMTFILIVIAVTSAITNKTSRKRKFRRK